jgi:hypothetical protein
LQKGFTGVELTGLAAGALGAVGTVEIGDMVVADVFEPNSEGDGLSVFERGE